MRKITYEELEKKHSYGKTNSLKNIKQILIDQGYSEAQIKWLRLNDMVLTVPHTYASKLKDGMDLIIMDEPPRNKVKVKPQTSARFACIGSEEE